MLNQELIVKGPPCNCDIPTGWAVGKYLIDCLRKRRQEDVFCVDGVSNKTLTCGKVVNDALKLAHLLRTFGVEKGDVVAVLSENTIQYATITIAIIYIGATANLLNPSYSPRELRHALTMAKPKLIFCSTSAYENVSKIKNELDFVEHLIPVQAEGVNNADGDTLDALLDGTTVDVDNVEPSEINSTEDLAMILLSSGTTGLPKGVMITHENVRLSACYFGDPNYGGIQPGDVTISVLPFFHILGLSTILNATVYAMKFVVLPSFLPNVYLGCVQEHKATIIYAVPPIVSFLAKHPLAKQFDLSSIRFVLCAGGCLGKDIQEEFIKSYPHIIIHQMYGITEIVGAGTVYTGSCSNKIGSVGVVIPDTEVMVWNADLKKNVGALEVGEICFKGPSVMKGYIGRETNDIDEFGFCHTGDIGYFDEENYFYIVGRIKELIKYKGFQVAPAELEDLLLSHPAVKECGVIGVPDDKAGQLPTALVVKQKSADVTESEIVNFVAERISVQKHLHGGVKFIDAIPRNALGKILRDELFDMYKQR